MKKTVFFILITAFCCTSKSDSKQKYPLRVLVYSHSNKDGYLSFFYRAPDEDWKTENSVTQNLKDDSVQQVSKFIIPSLSQYIRFDFGSQKNHVLTIDSLIFRYKDKQITVPKEVISDLLKDSEQYAYYDKNTVSITANADSSPPIASIVLDENLQKELIRYFELGEEISFLPYSAKEQTAQLIPSTNIKANVETVSATGDSIMIKGWVYQDKTNSKKNNSFVILRNKSNNPKIYNTKTVIRADVTSYFNDGSNYDDSGFDFYMSGLEKGEYFIDVGVGSIDKDTVFITESGKNIIIK